MNNIYWVIIEANFCASITSTDKNIADTVGFFQTFGCTASTEETLKEDIYSSLFKTEWLENLQPKISFDISIIDHHDVKKEILLDNEISEELISSPYKKGIWYQSGRSYFHEEDNDDEEGYLVDVVPNSH